MPPESGAPVARQLTKLLVDIEAKTASLEKGMARSAKSIRRTEKSTASLNKGMKLLTRTMGTLGVGLGVRELVQMSRSMAEFGAEITHTADRVGFATDELQALRAEGEQIGVGFSTTDMALQRFSRRLGEAQQGTGELLGTLQGLEIGLRETDGTARSVQAVFDDYAKAIQNAESDQEQLRLAFKAFDSEGAAFVAVLEQAGFTLEEAKEKAEGMGLVLREDLARALEQVDTEIGISITQIKVWGATWVGEIAKVLTRTESLSELSARARLLRDSIISVQESMDDKSLAGNIDRKLDEFFGQPQQERLQKYQAELFDVEQQIRAMLEVASDPDISGGASAPPRVFEETEKAAFSAAAAVDDFSERASSALTTVQQAQERITGGFADEWANAMVTGEANFRRFTQSVLADLLRIINRQILLNLLTRTIGGTGLGDLFGIPAGAGGGGGGGGLPPSRIGALPGGGGSLATLPVAPKQVATAAGGGAGAFAPSVTVNLSGPVNNAEETGQLIGAEVSRQIRSLWRAEAQNQKRPGGVLNPVT